MIESTLFIAIFFPFISSPIFFLLEKIRFRNLGLVSSLISLLSFLCITSLWISTLPNESETISIPWVPSLGINLSFIVDGLSLFFGFIVTGMGILVNFYANYYMDPNDKGLGRLYCSLTCFMGAMLGVVFSDDLMLLYMFWEITGLISFLLIGYHRESPLASKNARLALLVTFLTGMFLFIAIILIGLIDDTFLWSELIKKGVNFSDQASWGYIIMFFMMIGIFGKSAQLPFHFWLPKAMVAPIPVSAYLHAATMVKLGIFLTARVYPFFVTMDGWFAILTSVCYATMLLGAVLSLLSNDLKAILAYATISQLGFFIGFYGMGGRAGVQFDFIHIFNHALYKGSLFMLVGIISKATGVRDIRYLGGLWKHMPWTAIPFFVATAAMAGIPGTTGFLSKELFLSNYFDRSWDVTLVMILIVLLTAFVFKVAFSLRLFFHLFVRKKGAEEFEVKSTGVMVLLPPYLLSFLALLFGIWPEGLEYITGSLFVRSLHLNEPVDLSLLHGWEYETFVSFGVLIAGGILFALAEKFNIWWTHHKILDWGGLWEKGFSELPEIATRFTDLIHPKKQNISLSFLFIGFSLVFITTGFYGHIPIRSFSLNWIRLVLAFLISLASVATILFQGKLTKLLSLSISGFLVTIYFVFFAAPDLAMTQILVEVVTLLLLILVFSIIEKRAYIYENKKDGFYRLIIGALVGLATAIVAAMVSTDGKDSFLTPFFVQASSPLAHGNNLVNTILVDFRGLDTLGETTVLIIAAFGVWALLFRTEDFKILTTLIPTPMLQIVIPFVFVLVNIFSLHLLIRGHDFPGGGFIAGLASGISIILLSMVYQTKQMMTISWWNFGRIGVLGLIFMVLVTLFPLTVEEPLLTHYIFNIKSPLLFDVGIYFAVLGVTLRIYLSMRTRLFGDEHHAG